MRTLILLTTVLISLNALAHVGLVPPKVAPGPGNKKLIYCDFNTPQYKLFIDLYFNYNPKSDTYTIMEVGVFQDPQQQAYPQYLWGSSLAEFPSQGLHAYTIHKDPMGLLTFMTYGNNKGVILPKQKGVIQDFTTKVHGQMFYPSHAQYINNDFLCYDPSTKPRSTRF